MAGDPDLREDLRRRGPERAQMFSGEISASLTLALYEEVVQA
jgi:hypothetical protein